MCTLSAVQPMLRVYSVPQDAFESSDDSDDSSGDEGGRSVEPLLLLEGPTH